MPVTMVPVVNNPIILVPPLMELFTDRDQVPRFTVPILRIIEVLVRNLSDRDA
jgi:hypothetical protein